MRVLLIAGSSRSGSTIFGNVIGSVQGVAHFGEMHRIWQRGFLQDWLCGCGKRFRNCEFWREVMSRAIGQVVPRTVERIENLRVQVHRQLSAYQGEISSPQTREYQGYVRDLFDAVAAVSGCKVVVDSSKTAAHGWSLAGVTDTSVVVVHLVRDPRAVAFSWARRKELPDSPKQPFMNRRSVEESCKIWNITNERAERLIDRAGVPNIRLRYEDFAASPRERINEIFELLGCGVHNPDFVDERRVQLSPGHTISGNPSKFDHNGVVEIRLDDEWKRAMSAEDIAYATQATLPRLRAYGYELE